MTLNFEQRLNDYRITCGVACGTPLSKVLHHNQLEPRHTTHKKCTTNYIRRVAVV